MNKKLIYGFLTITMGLFMMACGEAQSTSPQAVAVVPVIPVTGSGQLANPNQACNSTTCTYSGYVEVAHAGNFALLGHNQIFQQPAENNNIDLGRFFTHPSSALQELWDQICPEQTGGIIWDSETGFGIQLGCRGSSSNDNLLPPPNVGARYRMVIQLSLIHI